jgi:glyoxylase-like metal-dependent hydrolase (beta-lactamase superfamily II)
MVFFDPLAPGEDGEFWSWADARCAGRTVAVLETIHFHRRNREEFAARYDAAAVAPAGVVAHHFPLADETVYWLPDARALIPGDTLIERDGELSLCPASWLEYLDARPTRAAVAAALRELCSLDVELVLVSHGEPVVGEARASLARALEAA